MGTAVGYLKVLSENLPGGTEENDEYHQSEYFNPKTPEYEAGTIHLFWV
jgi:hypothetical protein